MAKSQQMVVINKLLLMIVHYVVCGKHPFRVIMFRPHCFSKYVLKIGLSSFASIFPPQVISLLQLFFSSIIDPKQITFYLDFSNLVFWHTKVGYEMILELCMNFR